jgi:hypothetical protein
MDIMLTESGQILKPVVALCGWTMLMWLWMYATRLPAMKRANIDGLQMVGTTGRELRENLVAKGEERASWIADNYNHLHEAPTIFYATAIVLALTGQGGNFNLTLAWVYVGLRIAHSITQATFNRVVVRFALFVLSTLTLMSMVLHAAIRVFH